MAPEQEQVPAASTSGTGNSTGAASPPNAGEVVQFTPAQQAHLDNVIAERLKRAKEKWEADTTAAQRKAEEAAEAVRLAEQQKWQELAQKREGMVKDLEGKLAEAGRERTRLERLEAALKSHLDAARAGLPPHLLALLDKMPTEEQLEYIAANAAALRPGQAASIPPTPAATNAPALNEAERRAAAVSVRSYW